MMRALAVPPARGECAPAGRPHHLRCHTGVSSRRPVALSPRGGSTGCWGGIAGEGMVVEKTGRRLAVMCSAGGPNGSNRREVHIELPPVGVFDSGIGGLSVVAAMQELQPRLPVRYVADNGFFPYGDRDPTEIRERVLSVGQDLVDGGCCMLVVACNTACSAALEELRAHVGVPVVGVEPPLKPAVRASRARKVVVLATRGTAAGARLARLQENWAAGSLVWALPMPGLADLVESGVVSGEQVEDMLRSSMDEALGEGADAVALGCTHYAFLEGALRELLPGHVRIVNSAFPVARRALQLHSQVCVERGLMTSEEVEALYGDALKSYDPDGMPDGAWGLGVLRGTGGNDVSRGSSSGGGDGESGAEEGGGDEEGWEEWAEVEVTATGDQAAVRDAVARLVAQGQRLPRRTRFHRGAVPQDWGQQEETRG